MDDVEKIKAARRARTSQEIADALRETGMSRKEFAQKMGRMPSEVTKWLGGDHNFTTNLLAEISVVLGKPISGAEEILSGAEVSSLVSGYRTAAPAEFCEPSACSLFDVEIPFDVADLLRHKAEMQGMTFRQFVKELLCAKAHEKSVALSDYAGTVDGNFPSVEEIRGMRTKNSRVECDIF